MMRIGYGNDTHRLEAGRALIIGGVRIESEVGAVGHSDADALTHAITDAILGAISAGDIGQHFSDRDPRWQGADSFVFLKEAARLMTVRGFEIGNIDSTVSLERPKLRPHIDQMRANIAAALGVSVDQVSVKAKTGEGVDAVGEGRAIRVDSVVLLKLAR
jgi:2-C-methyl-D-erythritol 2,4-cyclodiphosphate synthase